MLLQVLFLLSILHVLAMKQQIAASELQVPLVTAIRGSCGAMESSVCCLPLELRAFSAIPTSRAARIQFQVVRSCITHGKTSGMSSAYKTIRVWGRGHLGHKG